jgi:hypothetical protein
MREVLAQTRAIAVGSAAALVLSACAVDIGEPLTASPSAEKRSDEREPDPSPLVDTGEIVSGGPPPDGIPPIDDPRFLSAREVDFLDPREPVIVLEIGDDARAYPARILIWHEIVNDVVGGIPVAVTYCPLCNTGVVFERPTIDGELLDFGTSGKLYLSNLVMYDRQTESLWPQALGQAVVGPLTGTRLDLLPTQIVSWVDFRTTHPGGRVLSQQTGFERPYGENPYVGYDEADSDAFLFTGDVDDRLPTKARVVGVRIGARAVAYPYAELVRASIGGWSVLRDRVGDEDLVVFWKAGTLSAVDAGAIEDSREVGATGVFRPRADGRALEFRATPDGIVDDQTGSTWDIFGRAVSGPLVGGELERVVSIESFWFDWAAFFPGTEVFGTEY